VPTKPPTYRPPGPPARRLYERQAVRRADRGFYASPRWTKLRDLVRAEEPLCRSCLKAGRVSPTEAVDHVLDRKARPDLALDRDNLQGLCKACHNAKRSGR
jgi:5-methylcytosine-specific restriction enzyme A